MNLLGQSSPQKIKLISKILRVRAKFKGLHQGQGRVSEIYFSDYILDILDIIWLERLMPGASAKFRGAYFQSIDGALVNSNIGAAYQVYVLAFAVLYPSVDAALQAIISCDR